VPFLFILIKGGTMGFWIFILFVIITIGYFRFQKIENQLSRLDKEFSSLHDLFMELKESVTIHKTKPSSVEEEIKIQETIATASKETVKVPPATELPPAVEIPPMPEMPPPSPLPPKPYIPSYTPLKSSDDLRPTVSSTYTEEEESRQNLNQEIHRPSSIELKWQEFKANVDWEQFTGVKLFAWLGGLALFIAAIFFVKYSIDNNYINFISFLKNNTTDLVLMDEKITLSSVTGGQQTTPQIIDPNIEEEMKEVTPKDFFNKYKSEQREEVAPDIIAQVYEYIASKKTLTPTFGIDIKNFKYIAYSIEDSIEKKYPETTTPEFFNTSAIVSVILEIAL